MNDIIYNFIWIYFFCSEFFTFEHIKFLFENFSDLKNCRLKYNNTVYFENLGEFWIN